jgi:hypothetical protein
MLTPEQTAANDAIEMVAQFIERSTMMPPRVAAIAIRGMKTQEFNEPVFSDGNTIFNCKKRDHDQGEVSTGIGYPTFNKTALRES